MLLSSHSLHQPAKADSTVKLVFSFRQWRCSVIDGTGVALAPSILARIARIPSVEVVRRCGSLDKGETESNIFSEPWIVVTMLGGHSTAYLRR